ncbi:uncharacterized protein EI90DRAFT_2914624 [Cantharellus anzutake]|uniref:uncharacterized protein n=1 Tax=Cantharellus anzutake TaxID=1750568 RepID=UPI00190794C8|nr:uncharacterized protein EI90DRAFT_2914624 [Cantharellus anzutake]KAF8334705.1 hypothetical protein EI90DRAFT_2914624 [Cantharellus anzutake]
MAGLRALKKSLKASERYYAAKEAAGGTSSKDRPDADFLKELRSIPRIAPSIRRSQQPGTEKTTAPIHHSANDPNEYTSSFNPLEEFGSSFPDPPSPYLGTIPIGLDTTVERVICTPLDARWSKHALKRKRQHVCWDNIVLPQLIPVYTRWERLHYSGMKATPRADPCNCEGSHQALKVVCMQFDRKDEVDLMVCNARPTWHQQKILVKLGMFPCAPCHPSLAVSIDVLEWVSLLSTFTALNNCAWAATMQIVLQRHSFHFDAKDSLRRRFTNALKYYQSLKSLVQAELIHLAQTHMPPSQRLSMILQLQENDLDTDAGPSVSSLNSPHPGNTQNGTNFNAKTPINHRMYENAHHIPSQGTPKADDQPSSFLHSRCPLCFGGSHTKAEDVQVIVCCDANFQLKRIKDQDRWHGMEGNIGSKDPMFTSPRTVFLSDDFVQSWKNRVETIRPPKRTSKKRKEQAGEMVDIEHAPNDVDDRRELNLPVPNSTYDACSESFIAADGERIKASTDYFANTGVMGILCRHDIPLFLVNIQTAGEKQHYLFALIAKFFEHVPDWWQVGILYDIGCQGDRTLRKYNIAPEWQSQIAWGVSIFHAYGHQYACQLWYHPRKSKPRGLTDGEGCKRVWSQLQQLIPGLRVTGHYRRLFLIDLQVEHIESMKLPDIGKWLRDHLRRARERLDVAIARLENNGISAPDLLAQFEDQRCYYSKPLECQSKTAAQKLVDWVMSLKAELRTQETLYEELIHTRPGDDDLVHQLELQQFMERVAKEILRLKGLLATNMHKLGAQGDATLEELERLKKDEWTNELINFRVLRDQLIRKLRSRRFELSVLDHSKACTIDQNVKAHVEKAAKSRLSAIDITLQKYNEKLELLRRLQHTSPAHHNKHIPPLLTCDTVLQLDVDQDLWQEFFDHDPGEGELPKWMTDSGVRGNIPYAQEMDNCQSEICRLTAEHANLRQWLAEEYAAYSSLFQSCQEKGSVDIAFLALNWLHELHDLSIPWQNHTQNVPCPLNALMWLDTTPQCQRRIFVATIKMSNTQAFGTLMLMVRRQMVAVIVAMRQVKMMMRMVR